MRIFITGAASRLGRRLCDLLEPHTLIALRHRAAVPERARAVTGALERPETYRAALADADAVVHLAAVTHAQRREHYFRINVRGTRALAEAAAAADVGHFVLVSSRAAGAGGGAYSESKSRAEDIVRSSGIPWTIFRPSEIWSHDAREGLPALLRLATRLRIFPLPVTPEPPPLAPVELDAVAQAIARSVGEARCHGRCYVLAGPRPATFAQLRRRLAPGTLPIPLPLLPLHVAAAAGALPAIAPDQISRLLLKKQTDITQAERDLGFHPKEITA